MVRATFRCQSIESQTVKFTAAIDDANKNWSQYTPWGEITMGITNPDALKQFKVGEHYYLDFSPAPAIEAPQV